MVRDRSRLRRGCVPLRTGGDDDDGGVLLRSRLGDGRGWYVLDAVDVAAARTLLGQRVGTLGEVALDEWYATDLLVDLPLRVRG